MPKITKHTVEGKANKQEVSPEASPKTQAKIVNDYTGNGEDEAKQRMHRIGEQTLTQKIKKFQLNVLLILDQANSLCEDMRLANVSHKNITVALSKLDLCNRLVSEYMKENGGRSNA